MVAEKKTAKSAVKPAKVAPKTQAPKADAAPRHKREITGIVVSDKMQKTIVVQVNRKIRHGLYKKYLTKSQKFKAHDENNDAKIGDLVQLVESRPLSRDKRWALVKIVRRSAQAIEVAV